METRIENTASNHNTGQCIALCLDCYRICMETAMTDCLERGGKHVEPRHFRLMIDCAEICRTAAALMLSGSDLHGKVCAVCADVCDACAQSCQNLDMPECVEACRRCAESCRLMTAVTPGKDRPALLQPVAAQV